MNEDRRINDDLKELMDVGDIYLNEHGFPYMVIGGMNTVLFASIRDLIEAKEELVGEKR